MFAIEAFHKAGANEDEEEVRLRLVAEYMAELAAKSHDELVAVIVTLEEKIEQLRLDAIRRRNEAMEQQCKEDEERALAAAP